MSNSTADPYLPDSDHGTRSSTRYTIIRFLACLLTVGIIFGHTQLPPKKISIYPREGVYPGLYSDKSYGGKSDAYWVKKQERRWGCDLIRSDVTLNCGMSVVWSDDVPIPNDMSGFDKIQLDITYKGTAENSRFYIRNSHPAYTKDDDHNSSKFMYVYFRNSSEPTTVTIDLNELSVIHWWLLLYNVPREHVHVDLTNVVAMGIDQEIEGHHEYTISKITLIGSWVKTDVFYLSIILIWMGILITEGLYRFYLMRQKNHSMTRLVNDLVASYGKIESDRRKYAQLSTTDPLTGIANRAGLATRTAHFFPHRENTETALLLIDLDYFKNINDTYGHDIGDEILKKASRIIDKNIRKHDIFCRWGGEEFLLICPNTSREKATTLAENLRLKIYDKPLNEQIIDHITVSIGYTIIQQDELFDDVFKRADKALYEAKNSGRNRAIFR